MKKVLITGGAGFIGSNLCLALLTRGYQVTVVDSLSRQVHGENPKKTYLVKRILDKVTFVEGDILDDAIWQKHLPDKDVVVHLAAETGTGQSMYSIEGYTSVNVLGTAKLLRYLAEIPNHVSKVVLTSSRAVYGEGKYQCTSHGTQFPEIRSPEHMLAGDFSLKCPVCSANMTPLPTDENSILNPSSIYGITKLSQEQLLRNFCSSRKLPSVVLRLQNVYGPGQSLINPYTGILSIFSNLIAQNKQINIFEDGNESRDFVFIDDVVHAIIAGIEYKSSTIPGVFNVGSGVKTTVTELVEMLCRCNGKKADYKISGDFRVGDIRHCFADTKKANICLGFEAQTDLLQGLSSFSRWVLDQKIIGQRDTEYENSIKEMADKGLMYRK